MLFYDSHLHVAGDEAGGFFVGLEGSPRFADVLTNVQALSLHSPSDKRVGFYYVNAEALRVRQQHPFLKYHPRREKYAPEAVIESIGLSHPKGVMVDTLNEPFWTPYDYWKVARAFPSMPFVFAHAGGYLIQDFIKICHFQPNVWIDFALTHTSFGGISKNPLAYVDDAIRYSLHAPFCSRVLMGSDTPFFSQADVVAYYEKLGTVELMNENFGRLLRTFIS